MLSHSLGPSVFGMSVAIVVVDVNVVCGYENWLTPCGRLSPMMAAYSMRLTFLVFLLILMGCTQGLSEAEIEAIVEARVQEALKKLEPTPVPSATPSPTMKDVLSVTLTSIRVRVLPVGTMESRFSPLQIIRFGFTYENLGQTDIRAFTGVVQFNDIFDREIMKLRLTNDEFIPAGQFITDSEKGMGVNQFLDDHVQLAGTELHNLIVHYEPESIIFSDGTQIGSAK